MFRNFTLFFAFFLAKAAHAENELCAFLVPYGTYGEPTRRLGDSSALTDPLGFTRQLPVSDATNVTVDYDGGTTSGGTFCELCGNTTTLIDDVEYDIPNSVACSTYTTWENGTRTFIDPGFQTSTCASTLTITLSGTCGFNSLDIYLNDNLIGNTTTDEFDSQSCICELAGDCLRKIITIEGHNAIQDVYNFSGNNSLHVEFRDVGQVIDNTTNSETQVCLDYAVVELEAGDCPAEQCVASCAGDPHFQPIMAPPFSYHGQFDGVLMSSEEFAFGSGFDIHIRTTRVDNPYISYSYISGAAVRVGNDILEVQDDGSVLVNGAEEFDDMDTADFGEYTILKSLSGARRNIFIYDLAFPAEDMSIQIRANTRNGLLFVDVFGTVPSDTVGLLGSPQHDALFARDGKTDLTGEWNSFGEEWQVQSHELKLFSDKDRFPQHPVSCVYEASVETVGLRRRHLMDTTRITPEAANAACDGASELKKQFCIDDVLAMSDAELAEDPFYNN